MTNKHKMTSYVTTVGHYRIYYNYLSRDYKVHHAIGDLVYRHELQDRAIAWARNQMCKCSDRELDGAAPTMCSFCANERRQ